jgi:restriction endonuclease S subunit
MSEIPFGLLGEIAKGKRGVSYKPEDITQGTQQKHYRLLTARNIQEGITTTDSYTRVPIKCVSHDQLISPNDILVCMSNGSKRLVGKSSRLRSIDSKEYCVGAFCSTFTPTDSADPEFVFQIFQSKIFKRQVSDALEGSAINNLKNSTIENFQVPVPPLPEQKKISEILSGIDLQISNTKVKVGKYRHLLNSIINQLMTFGTRGQKVIETDAGSYPENWRIGKVEDFFTLGRGRVISIPYIKEHPGPYPVFSSQSKNNGEMGRMDTYDFDGDYFTWTTDGAYAGSVFSRSGKFNCTNVCGTGKAKSSSESDAKFASYFLRRVAKRHVSYVGNPKLMNNIFAEIPFALPPIEEQEEITRIIDSARKNIESIDGQIASLSNLKVSISSELLSGRKRVTV